MFIISLVRISREDAAESNGEWSFEREWIEKNMASRLELRKFYPNCYKHATEIEIEIEIGFFSSSIWKNQGTCH